jgi:hypothetical protein
MRQDAHEQLKMQGRKRPLEAIYPSSHEKQRTWVTLSQNYHLKRRSHQGIHLWDQMMHLRNEHGKKSYLKDLKH